MLIKKQNDMFTSCSLVCFIYLISVFVIRAYDLMKRCGIICGKYKIIDYNNRIKSEKQYMHLILLHVDYVN